MAFLTSIKLTQFRNYKTAELQNLSKGFVVLYGENGAGKTNILEAVSALAPGRSLRGAKWPELRNNHSNDPWAVSAKIETAETEARIGTGQDQQGDKRLIRINGAPAKSQAALAEYIRCLWLTPQMDGLFSGGASERRRFFDRLVTSFDPAHNGRLQRYENAVRQRVKLLIDEENRPDPNWLSALENDIAETGVALSAARVDFIQRLNDTTHNLHTDKTTGAFPQGVFKLTGDIEKTLTGKPALEVEDMMRTQLAQRRQADSVLKGASYGPHKCDIETTHIGKNMPASQCSTGEQKALLTGIILGHRHMIAQSKKELPILLLDEVAAHFDLKRRASLFGFLHDLGGQIWMTGTDSNLFDTVPSESLKYRVNKGVLDSG